MTSMSSYRKKIFIRIVGLFAFLQLTVVLGWLMIFPGENAGAKHGVVRNIINNKRQTNFVTIMKNKSTSLVLANQQVKPSAHEIKKEFQGVKFQDLVTKVKRGFGKNLKIDFIQRKDKKNVDVTFDFASPSFPKKIEFSELKTDSPITGRKPKRYVCVYCRSWEQMTMSMRALLSLCGQAKIGGRKVVKPFVKDSRFDHRKDSWNSLGLYFDMKHANSIIEASGYAALVDKKEYDTECSSNISSHATIHFINNAEKVVNVTKARLHLSDAEYDKIRQGAKTKGWTKCSFIEKEIGKKSGSKQFCVDPSVIRDWSVLERDVVRGAKCLTIYSWRGIGERYRTYFSEKDMKVSSRDLHFALKPSMDIQNEVRRLRKDFLPGRYIAVQVRGEIIVVQHNLDWLRKCINLLIEVIRALKETSGVSQVLLATDMSNFGSGSWPGSLKGETYDDNTLTNLQDSLVLNTGGVVYKPTADNPDRGVVALVEMELISQAQHLVTIGGGSFQDWIVAKFLEYHRDVAQPLWSQITTCSKL